MIYGMISETLSPRYEDGKSVSVILQNTTIGVCHTTMVDHAHSMSHSQSMGHHQSRVLWSRNMIVVTQTEIIMKERTIIFEVKGNIAEVWKVYALSNKRRNKEVKSKNGNGDNRQNITILHWNLGSRMWHRKTLEIEAAILQYSPDVFVITEANLLKTLQEDKRKIPGYSLILPKILPDQVIYKIAVLIREGVNVEILDELNVEQVAAVWLKLGSRGRKPMIVGCIYREFQYIHQVNPDDSGSGRQSTGQMESLH